MNDVANRPATEKPYHIALSFAGEDRAYVEKVAELLRSRKIRVFYDKHEEARLWGKDLHSYLSKVYSEDAHFTVMFISQHYSAKLWTNHERRAAQARAFRDNSEYILPVRFDDTEIPGILDTVGYVSLHERDPEDLAILIEEKLISHKLVEPQAAPEDKATAVEIIRRVVDSTPSLASEILVEGAHYAREAAGNYAEHCHTLYQNMRILAMPEPIALSHIFTQVRVADRIRSNQSSTELDVFRDIISNRGKKERVGMNATSLFKSQSRTVLLGGPGSGKSTFLKYTLLKELQADSVLQIPILLPLNELDQRNKSVLENLVQILDHCGIVSARGLLTALLRAGRVRVLIDGLDEVRLDDRIQIVREINQLMARYRTCSFIITCRTAGYEYWFGDCRHYEVQRFSKRSITAFVLRWFSSERKKARELLAQILPSARMRDLCSSPLMISIVCIGFDAGIDLSNNRAEIYKDAIDALLRKWDASRSIYRDNIYRSLTPKRREDLLCDLASRTFVNNQIVIQDAQAKEIVSRFLKTMPTSPDISVDNDAEIVLRAIETQHGLIEKRSIQFWAFAHLTFQEFFVAQYLASRDLESRTSAVRTYIDKPEWREVIMLTAALLPNADDFVLEILGALTKMGYGEFFVKQTLREISEARKSSDHKRFRSDILFPQTPDEGKPVKLRSHAFGIIEGGVRLSVEEIQIALSQFRESIGTLGSAPSFVEIIDELRSYDGISERYLKQRELSDLLAGDPPPEGQGDDDPGTPGRSAYLYLRRWLPDVLNKLEDEVSFALESFDMNKNRAIDFDAKAKFLLTLMRAYGVFENENAEASKKLHDLFEPNSLFELTSRKYMFVVPACLPECEDSVTSIVDELKTDGTRTILLQECTDRELVEKIEQTLLNVVRGSILQQIHFAAAKNTTETAKLRAFIAGDTLAEVLMSQAFLTPIVREAAVRTLNNMINNVPPPTDGPPSNRKTDIESLQRGALG